MTLGLVFLGCGLVAIVLVVRHQSIHRTGRPEVARAKVRRAGGHAMLVLQEFVEPRVEHVHHVAEERKDDEDHGAGDDADLAESQVRDDLMASLSERPVDPHEVRRHLATARAAGLDWRRLYAESVQTVLADQPYLAPFLPPAERVSPWEGDGRA